MKKVIFSLVVLLTFVTFFYYFQKTKTAIPKYNNRQLANEINKCNFPYESFETTIKTDEVISENNNKLIRHLIIDSSNYCINNVSKPFQVVKVKGFDSTFGKKTPVMPISGHPFKLRFPNNPEITYVEIEPQDKFLLGKLNIPCSNPINNTSNKGGNYYDCPKDFEIFPENQEYKISDYGDSKAVLLFLYPVVHNLKTKETSIYKKFSIKIHYESVSKIENSAK